MNRDYRSLRVFLTLMVVALNGSAAEPPGVLNYQGRIIVDGTNFDGLGAFKFALVDGGTLVSNPPNPSTWIYTTYWSHDGSSAKGEAPLSSVPLTVSHGLYQVLLGDTTVPGMTESVPTTVFEHDAVYLRVWFDDGKNGFQPLAPDHRIASVGYALQAARIQDEGVTTAMLAEGAVTTAILGDDAVTSAKIAPGAIQSVHLDRAEDEAFTALLEALLPLGGGSPLPLEQILPVVVTNGVAPAFSFSIDGVIFGTVIGFTGSEGMSEPSRYAIELHDTGALVDPTTWIGLRGQLSFTRNGRSTDFGGVITGAQRSRRDATGFLYSVRLEPPLAWLGLSSDYRMFQGQTIPDVFDRVYGDGLGQIYHSGLNGSYDSRETLVQYGETDFSFISRLMEEAGIFYFFDPDFGPPQLVLGDTPAAYQTAAYSPFDYFGNEATPPAAGTEYVQRFFGSRKISTRESTVGGYDFQNPSANLDATRTGSGIRGETYDFETTSLAQSAQRATVLRDRQAVERSTTTGFANAPDLRPGHTFNLSDLSGAGLGGSYLVTQVHHVGFNRATGSGTELVYGNRFEVIPAALPFRPARMTPKPKVPGITTAVVTGPAGEAIYADSFGRVKVQFHWDRVGGTDENSSGWIRFTSPFAGASGTRGMFFLPQVGDEVVVSFIEGDPDRPVIVGSLYNGSNPPPFPLPADKTLSTLRSNAPGGAMSEIRFENKVGEEALSLIGGRDVSLKAIQDLLIHSGGNLTLQADNALDLGVGADLDLAIGMDFNLISGLDLALTAAQDFSLLAGRNLSLEATSAMALGVGTDMVFTVGDSLSLSVGGDLSLDLGSNLSVSLSDALTLDAGQTVQITSNVGKYLANTDLTLTAGDDISLTAADRVTISGTLFVNGSAYAPPDASNLVSAWARVRSDGVLVAQTGIASVIRNSTGVYTVTVLAKANSAASLIPVAVAEIDSAPKDLATLRIVSVDQISNLSFKVYINSGSGARIDNDFVLTVGGN